MTDWERVKEDLRDAGYPGFAFDSGQTAVPGLSGEWVVGRIPREGRLQRENQPLLVRICDALPGNGGAVSTNPEYAPERVRTVAAQHELEVVILSARAESVRIALCDSSEQTPSS